jgi:nitroreductase/NAD-dependent dihydropyrimidine dehydrogenase PreA subunit
MKYFTVDKFKCTRCGACIAVCPISILKMDSVLRLPVIVNRGDRACIRCGHCVSVCPHRALSIYHMRAETLHPLRHDWRGSVEKIEHLMNGRRSIRNYRNEPVDREKLKRLVNIARYAPSAVNRQSVRWEIIYYRERVKAVSEAVIKWMRAHVEMRTPLSKYLRMKRIVAAWDAHNDWICRGAPHLVIAYAPKNDGGAAQDCTIALTYFELASAAAHLGTCWAGYVAIAVNACPQVRRLVYLSSRMQCYGAMMVGYQRFAYHRIPSREKPHIIWR